MNRKKQELKRCSVPLCLRSFDVNQCCVGASELWWTATLFTATEELTIKVVCEAGEIQVQKRKRVFRLISSIICDLEVLLFSHTRVTSKTVDGLPTASQCMFKVRVMIPTYMNENQKQVILGSVPCNTLTTPQLSLQ